MRDKAQIYFKKIQKTLLFPRTNDQLEKVFLSSMILIVPVFLSCDAHNPASSSLCISSTQNAISKTKSSCLGRQLHPDEQPRPGKGFPSFLLSYNFRKKNSKPRTERRWKKQLSSCMSMTKTEPDESASAPHMWRRELGLAECVKTAGKFPWACSNWKLIIFSLCFLSGGGSSQKATLWWDLDEIVGNV